MRVPSERSVQRGVCSRYSLASSKTIGGMPPRQGVHVSPASSLDIVIILIAEAPKGHLFAIRDNAPQSDKLCKWNDGPARPASRARPLRETNTACGQRC